MRRTVDFLCIDISSEVKKRILAFVSRFDERRDLLSYKGYYKFLYDYLSSEAKITNPISINSKATSSSARAGSSGSNPPLGRKPSTCFF